MGAREFLFTTSAIADDDLGRCPGYRTVVRHIAHNDEAVRADLDIVPHHNWPQQGRSGTDKNIVANCWVALPLVLARSSQRDVVKQDAVVADYGCLSDYHTHSMIDEEPLANSCARVNLKAGQEAVYLGKHSGKKWNSDLVYEMQNAVESDRVKPGIQQEFDILCRRIISVDCLYVFKYG